MVKRKRLSTSGNCEERSPTEENGNALPVECVSSSKKPSSSRETTCCNTRSKLKSTTSTTDNNNSQVAATAAVGEMSTTNEDNVDNNNINNNNKQQTPKISNIRSSARTMVKRTCRDASPVIQQPPRKLDKTQINKPSNLPEQKTRRSWELWSVEDKNAFFDALCEYGKDFDNIQHYIAQKNKKKNHLPQMIKNKDQVRHFYYRTWHKISKYLDISQDIKKQTQELYGLINYGELRKKLGGRLDKKNGQKLNELVHNGATMIRIKGKNVRVKTPLCGALKRLNAVDDPKDDYQPKLPPKLTLEFRPRDLNSWSRVQSIAHNPRLKMTVSLQRRVTSIVEYLQTKWRSHRFKTKEHLQMLLSEPETRDKESDDVIRILPCKDADITLISMTASTENATSASVSLQNYKDHVLPRGGLSVWSGGANSGNRKNSKKCRVVVDESDKKVNEDEVNLAAELSHKMLSPKEGTVDNVESALLDHEVALKQLLALTSAANLNCRSDEVEEKVSEKPKSDVECESGVEQEEKKEVVGDVDRIRQGWTAEECGGMTVGELFLILGSPTKLIMEYVWESKSTESSNEGENVINCGNGTSTSTNNETILNKLLQLASVTFADIVGKNKQNSDQASCRCGHVCPVSTFGVNSSKSNLTRSPAASRNTKNATKTIIPKTLHDTPTMSTSSTTSDHGLFLVPSTAAPQSKSQGNKSYASNKITDNAFKEQLDKLMPSHRKARGRNRKSVVIQRELLPKTSLSHSMMTLRIVPSTTQLAGSFLPVLSNAAVTVSTNPTVGPKVMKFTSARVVASPTVRNEIPTTLIDTSSTTTSSINLLPEAMSAAELNLNSEVVVDHNKSNGNAMPTTSTLELTIPDQTTETTAFTASPPSISLLDMAMPNCDVLQNENVRLALDSPEKLLDITLANSTSSFSAFNLSNPTTESKSISANNLLSTLPCLGVDSLQESPLVSVAVVSPFKVLDSNWLNGETNDMSLSSLLNNLESPLKNPISQAGAILNEENCGRLSCDVESQLQCMLNENSVDYVAKFADLAAQIAVSETPKKRAVSPTHLL